MLCASKRFRTLGVAKYKQFISIWSKIENRSTGMVINFQCGLQLLLLEGKAREELPPLKSIRDCCMKQLEQMRPDHMRRLNPTPYKVPQICILLAWHLVQCDFFYDCFLGCNCKNKFLSSPSRWAWVQSCTTSFISYGLMRHLWVSCSKGWISSASVQKEATWWFYSGWRSFFE